MVIDRGEAFVEDAVAFPFVFFVTLIQELAGGVGVYRVIFVASNEEEACWVLGDGLFDISEGGEIVFRWSRGENAHTCFSEDGAETGRLQDRKTGDVSKSGRLEGWIWDQLAQSGNQNNERQRRCSPNLIVGRSDWL